MVDAVKIQGKKLVDLFSSLIEEKVIISMHVVGVDFDRLTCITGFSQKTDGNHLLVDPPDDFGEVVSGKDRWHLEFNFNGPDQLEYIFSTRGGAFCEQGLKIPFPDHVERLQRRRNFRINTETGTKLHFKLKKIEGMIDLINVSLGGAYGVLVKHNMKFMRGSVLKTDQRIYNLSMVFPGDADRPGDTVYVEQADVKRVEHDQERGFFRYAFEFKGIAREEKDRLTQIIYDLQRKYLRRRK